MSIARTREAAGADSDREDGEGKAEKERRDAYQQPPFPAEEERVRSAIARVGVLRELLSRGESPSSARGA